MDEPEAVDEKESTPEIRGGNRPADYIKGPVKGTGAVSGADYEFGSEDADDPA